MEGKTEKQFIARFSQLQEQFDPKYDKAAIGFDMLLDEAKKIDENITKEQLFMYLTVATSVGKVDTVQGGMQIVGSGRPGFRLLT